MWPVGAVSSTTKAAARLGDDAREGVEHRDLLGAGRAQVLEQQRDALLVEFAALAGHDLGDVAFGLGRGIDPVDRAGPAPRPSTIDGRCAAGSVVLRCTA